MAEVKVKLPDGRIGTIPQENLEEAKKRGATLVEETPSIDQKAVTAGKSLIDNALETGEDLARGGLEGVTFGGSAEVLGGINALGSLATGQAKSTDELVNLYKKYRDIEDEKNRVSKQRSPYLYGGAEIGGGILSSLGTGGVAAEAALAKGLGSVGMKQAMKAGGGLLSKEAGKEIAKQGLASAVTAAPYGALQGALSGEGSLIGATPKEEEKLKSDAISGALSGGVIGAGIGATGALISGAKNAISDAATEYLNKYKNSQYADQRQLAQAYEMGKTGKDPFKDSQLIGKELPEGPLLGSSERAAKEVFDPIMQVDSTIGAKYGQALESYKDPINLRPDLKESLKQFADEGILENGSARGLDDLKKRLFDFSSKYEISDPQKAYNLRQLAKQLREAIADQVPGYREASKELLEFRKPIIDRILGKDAPEDLVERSFTNNKEGKLELFDQIQKMVEAASQPGTANKETRMAYSKFLDNLPQVSEDIGKKYPQLKGVLDPQKIQNTVQKGSDLYNTVRLLRGERISSGPSISESIVKPLQAIGGSEYGLKTVYYAGKADKFLGDTVNKINKMGDVELTKLADKLPEPIKSSVLKAVGNKDEASKNAIRFLIAQNPEYRKLITQEDIAGSEK